MLDSRSSFAGENSFWRIFDDKQRPVANFDVKVIAIENIQYTDYCVTQICVKIIFSVESCVFAKIPFEELDAVDWSEYDKRCVINKQRRTARAYFNDYIRCQFSKCEVQNKTGIDHQGISKVNDTAVFLAGDKLLVPEDKEDIRSQIEIRPNNFRLDIDNKLTLDEAYIGMKQLIDLSPDIGRILVAHTVSGLIRSAFQEIGFIPCAVLVIVGTSGMYKTHYTSHMTQLYNRNDIIKPVTRLNST